MKRTAAVCLTIGVLAGWYGCTEKHTAYRSYEDYPVPESSFVEMRYAPDTTVFTLWAPTATEVAVRLYEAAEGGYAYRYISLLPKKNGIWSGVSTEDLEGKFYTFEVRTDRWLGETPGINARVVGVNGQRGAIIHPRTTDPPGWEADKRPVAIRPEEMVIYELHLRDFSMDSVSGMNQKGKYLALTERYRTLDRAGSILSTGLDHLLELGVTHINLLPVFDFSAVDENYIGNDDYIQHSWGYEPLNHNALEGSYSTQPTVPAMRIREFKQLIQILHQYGLRVIVSVDFGHTVSADSVASAFEKTVPGYFYRHTLNGTYSEISGYGYETASERAGVRKYIVESVLFWLEEYHVDGFCFHGMSLHDTETMNAIRRAVDRIDSTVVIMGDGRSLGAHLPINKQATPTLVDSLPRLLFFGNELYDGLHGNSLADTVGGFLSAANGYVENIKFGIVGGIRHPQVNDSLVSYADNQWHAPQPTQFIGYAARSDGYSLSDRLRKALPGLTTERMIALDKLAQTAIFTSQGIPFLSNGEELLRTKKGLDYTSHSSDLVNAVEWSYKELYYDVFSYCRSLIQLRHRHPAFRMGNAESICRHLEFLPVEQSNVVAYRLKDHAGGDEWEEIIVILNASPYPVHTQIPADRYRVIAGEGRIDELSTETVDGPDIYVHPESAMILAR